MSGSSSPIDIISPNRFSSSSPRNQASNLTSALRQAGSLDDAADVDSQTTLADRLAPNRQDSMQLGSSPFANGARPISGAGKPRRESMTGSFMGGTSWGGGSLSTFLQDDIMMTGTSPYNMQSPSYHSSSYLPKLEANFWTNLKCCGETFNDLHGLVAHFEDVHKQAPSHYPYRASSIGGGLFPRRKSSNLSVTNGTSTPVNQVRGFQPEPRLTGTVNDMETIGEMEMDEGDSEPFGQEFSPVPNPQETFSTDTTPKMTSIHPSSTQNLYSSQRNPMVSSVNTPTFGNQQTDELSQKFQANGDNMPGPYSSNIPFNAQMLQQLNADFGNLDFNNSNGMLDYCINEPAKNLYSEDGRFNSQKFPNFNFQNQGGDITNNADENARKLQAQRLASGAGKVPTEEERPFKCPVIGCEKSYKNANGLRYHEKHGHSTQKLKDNGDGTFSIVDPVTSIPYPGTLGMEKEKPYQCDVCGKRYKNLNGLKYHRNHSPPCNPDYQVGRSPMPDMGADLNSETVF